jgi:hypothetical protein
MTDVNEAGGWARDLDELAERLAPRFVRVAARRQPPPAPALRKA